MHSKKELDLRIQKSGIQPLKKLGQNFLVNPAICEKIVTTALSQNASQIFEIGPGLGALTDKLMESGLPLTLVELDSGLVKYWEERNQKIIHKDALKLDWKSLDISNASVLVSNLPYSIAASIVVEMSLLDIFDSMILMFQKEVAERIAAHLDDADYGMLSVVAQSFWTIEKVVDAGPQDFYPVPNVGSRVLKFKRKAGARNRQEFVDFVKLAFSQRRKKLTSNLGKSFSMEKLKSVLSTLGFGEDVRAQELSPQQFQEVFDSLRK